MKNFSLVLTALVVVGFIFLTVKGNEVQEIKTEIEISASPEDVWQILSDVDKWQDWSPIINKSSGSLTLGNTIEITMVGKETGKDGPQYSPKIVELESKKSFRWRAHMIAGFIFTNDKVFELYQTQTGTRVVHKEIFSGLLAPVFKGQMEKGVPPMLDSMNQALKQLVEG